MQISLEPYSEELVKELSGLFEDHCEEISMFGEQVSPDLKIYKVLADNGNLLLYIAREDGKTIGYLTFIIHHHLHYSNMQVADQDILFLDKKHRKGMAGMKLIKFAENDMKERKLADVILQHTKVAKRDLSKMFERLGYVEMERVFMRRL